MSSVDGPLAGAVSDWLAAPKHRGVQSSSGSNAGRARRPALLETVVVVSNATAAVGDGEGTEADQGQ